MTTLVERLRPYSTAYPEDIFIPLTDEDLLEHGMLITRASAGMGRHCAKFMAEAAARIEELELENARLRAEAEALQKDARARSSYDRTAAAHGFANAPQWEELAEETRGIYRRHVAARAGQNESMGGSPDRSSECDVNPAGCSTGAKVSVAAGEPPAPYSREEIREALERAEDTLGNTDPGQPGAQQEL